MNWYKLTHSIEDRLGQCYILSGRYVLGHPNAELIHGIVTNRIGDGRTLEHAWVEYDNIVFDPVIEQEFQKEIYYALFIPKIIERYNHEEVCKIMLRNKHWGPWNEQNPPNKDFKLDK